jgi:hypothetical protein
VFPRDYKKVVQKRSDYMAKVNKNNL